MKEVQLPERLTKRISDFDQQIQDYITKQLDKVKGEREKFIQNLVEGFVAGLEDVNEDDRVEVLENNIKIYTAEEAEELNNKQEEQTNEDNNTESEG